MSRAIGALPLLLVLAACGADRATLEPLPEIDLGALQASFSGRVREEKTRVDRLLAAKGTPAGELAQAFGELGKLLQMSELVEPGVVCYRNAMALAPDDPRWPYYLAHLQLFAGDWDAASRGFERVLELRPDDLAAMLQLADLELQQGRVDEAQTRYRRALELGDTSGAALFGLGQVSVEQDRTEEAIEYFESALAAAPDASRVHYQLGVLHGRLGHREEAERHMALQGPGIPHYPDPLMTELRKTANDMKVEIAGSVAFREGRTEDALAELHAAEAKDPENYDVQLALGTTLATLERREEAESHFNEALRLAETRQMKSVAHLNMANLLMLEHREGEAAGHYRMTMELTPDLPEGQMARFELASVLVGLGRVDEAVPLYHESLEAGAHAVSNYLDLAQKLARAGRYPEVRWVYERGREAHPRDGHLANALARLLASCPDDAVRDGAVALDLAGSLFRAQRSGPHAVTLAMALAENGRFAEAVELQRNAIADAEKHGLDDIAAELREHLALYERGTPLRQP